MEEKFYEYRPHFYLAMSFYAVIVSHSSWLLVLSGILLAFNAYVILQARREYRNSSNKRMRPKTLSSTLCRSHVWS